MKLVYICSPLRGDIEANVRRAARYCAYAAGCGVIPIAPHVAWNGIFDDTVPEKRETALRLGLELLKRCDEVWVMGNEISQGMQGEIDEAARLHKATVYVLDEQVEKDMKIRQEHAPLDRADCIEAGDALDYKGKILVLDPEALKPQHRLSENSLWVASHGPGCMAGKHDRTVHAANLFTGELAAFGRYEFFGVVKPERLAQWLRDTPIRNNLAAEVSAQAPAQKQKRDLDYPYLLAQCGDEVLKILPNAKNIASYIWTRGTEYNHVTISTPDEKPLLFTVGGQLSPLCDADYFHKKLKPAFLALQKGKATPQPIIEVRDEDLQMDRQEDGEVEPEL